MNESTKSAHRRTAWTSEKWQLATDIPLTAAACLFLVAYAYQVLAQPTGLPHRLTEWTMWAAWVVFAVDYAVRLWLAPARGRWFVRHLLDLAMVVLPMLRPLRLLRLVTLLAIVHRSSGQSLRGRVVIYATGATALLIGVAGAGPARCRASRAGRCHHVVRNGIVVGDGDGHDRRLRRHGARYHDRAHDRRSIDDRRNCVCWAS